MKVFVISAGQDIGGQGIGIKRAFDRYTDWTVRAMHVSETYIKYPHDLTFDMREAHRLYDSADVVIHNDQLALYHQLDRGQRKPTVVHHNGSRLRDNARETHGEAVTLKAVETVSTVDLLDDAARATWIPQPCDLDWIRDKYARPTGQAPLTVGHSPTNPEVKGTEAIVHAMDALGEDIEPRLVQGLSWVVCLSHKGLCDVYVDQLTLGYGCNTVEAWAMGIPVIAGWADPKDKALFLRETGLKENALPFYEASEQNIAEKLRQMVESDELRREYGARGRAFAEKWHADRKVVERLKPILESCPPSVGAGFKETDVYDDWPTS